MPQRWPASAPAIVVIVGAEVPAGPFCCCSRRYSSQTVGGPAESIALCQRARESMFSRMPHRSCFVGVAGLVSHVCDNVWAVVRRRSGTGRRTRMKFLAARNELFSTYDEMVLGVPLSESSFHYLLWQATLACRPTVSPPSCNLPEGRVSAEDLSDDSATHTQHSIAS